MTKNRPHGIAGLSSLFKPINGALFIHINLVYGREIVETAQIFNNAPITGFPAVGNDDMMDGAFSAAPAL